LLVFAAWAVPPMLDWGRFRSSIGAIAAAELGRKVQIGGDVALRLFPQAVLTASDVTLPDRGDGVSVRIANLRLEVALGPLLVGRLVLRDLVLGGPVLTLPWPLPGGLVNPVRPSVPRPFAAHVEGGTLLIGQAEVTGITAAIHGGPAPAPGLVQDSGPVAAFGAEGFAKFDGQRWRFTTALGAPDADGVSAIDLAMQGQGRAHDTGGAIQGTLSEGVFQGRLHAGGPDLALIMPASPLSWHAEAPFVASGEKITSTAISLSLGGAPATATLALQLATPSRLDMRLTAASLDLDGWSSLLSGTFAGFTPPAIPMRLDLAADSARLLGGVLGGLSGALLFDGAHASLDHVQALLPGNAKLNFSGGITREPHAVFTVEGPATLDAPDLHATLAWLRPLAPALLNTLPSGVLRSARLGGTAKLAPGTLSASKIAGSLDGVPVTGGFELAFAGHPALVVDAGFDHLAIDDWLGGSGLHAGMALADFAGHFTALDTNLHLHAATATWDGQDFADFSLAGTSGAGGLKIDQASASFDGIKLDGSGLVGPDGSLSGVHAHAVAPDAGRILRHLPAGWRWAPGFWQGPAEMAFSADGAPGALDLQLRAGVSDLVLEAESKRDTLDGAADTTLTLRHPGTPRLLAALGFPGAEHVLETGSLAFLAHLHSAAGQVLVQDFSLDAAALHMGGHGTMDFSGADPLLDMDVAADSLALPDLAALTGTHVPAWQGRVGVTAKQLAVGGRIVAHNVSANLLAGAGDFLADPVTAEIAGGRLTARAAFDSARDVPMAALQGDVTGANVSGPLTSLPIDIDAGGIDLGFDVWASGHNEASWLGSLAGDAQLTLHDAQFSGFDLSRLTALLTPRTHPTHAALLQALTQGSSSGFSGDGSASFDHGRAKLTDVHISSADGAVSASGGFDLASGNIDLLLGITPSVADPPHYAIKLAGAPHELKPVVDLGKVVSAPKHLRPKK
jgi:hypothetical protein